MQTGTCQLSGTEMGGMQQSDTGKRSPKRKVSAPNALRFVHMDYTTSEHSGRLTKRRRIEVCFTVLRSF